MIPECLNDLVGIFEGDEFSCAGEEINNISTSGLFVTQDPAYNHCQLRAGETDCDILKLLIKNRDEAYREVTNDITIALSKKLSSRADSTGFIGQDSWSRYLSPSDVPARPFILIPTDFREGAFIEIKKITLMITPINGEVVVPLRVIRVSDGEILMTYNLVVTSLSTNPKIVTPFKIPCDGQTYRVEYDYDPAAFRVVLSHYYCGCGDKLKGAKGFMSEQFSANGDPVKSFGICIWARFGCNNGLEICALLNNPKYKIVVAYMIRKKIIELSLRYVLLQNEVSKFTLLGPDELSNLVDIYVAEYKERLDFFSWQTDFQVDGFCLTCSGSGMRKFSYLTGK